MHRSYAVRYVKYELMVCHKTLCTSLTKEYDSLYTTKKRKKKEAERRTIMSNQSTSKQKTKKKEIERKYHFLNDFDLCITQDVSKVYLNYQNMGNLRPFWAKLHDL